MAITGIDAVRFGVEELDQCRRYLNILGLDNPESSDSSAVYRTPEGHEIELRLSGDADLPPAVKKGPVLREFVYGVSSQADLDALHDELARDRKVRVDDSGRVRTMDDSGYGIAFQVTRVTPKKWEQPVFNSPSQPRRINQRADFSSGAHVRRFSHVTFFVPDSSAAEAFYVHRLNFRVTDRYKGLGAFMRAEGDPAHHTIFPMTVPNQAGVDHFAFEFDHVHDVIVAGNKLLAAGWETNLGPGRHIIGSNWFWYVKSPLGGSCELMSDFDYLTDEWVPHDFESDTPIAGWMDSASWEIFDQRMSSVRHG